MTIRFGKKSWMGVLAATALLVGNQTLVLGQESLPGSDALLGDAAVAVQDDDSGDDQAEVQEHEAILRAEIELLRAKLAEHEQALRGMTLRRQVDRAAMQREQALRAMEEARLADRVHGMLLQGQMAGRYWLGVQTMPLSELDEDARTELNVREVEQGLIVDAVVDDSPAKEAGIEEMDIIVKANGEPVDDVVELITIVTESEAEPITLALVRKGEDLEVTVTPVERPAAFAIPAEGFRINADDLADKFQLFAPAGGGVAIGDLIGGGNGISLQINREGDKPAEIKLQYKGESYEGTEDSIDMFPEEVREQVRQAVEGMRGDGNFNIMMMQSGAGAAGGADGVAEFHGLLLAPQDLQLREGLNIELPAELQRRIRLGDEIEVLRLSLGAEAEAEGEAEADAVAGSDELAEMRAEMAEIKAMLKRLLEDRE